MLVFHGRQTALFVQQAKRQPSSYSQLTKSFGFAVGRPKVVVIGL